MALAVKPPARTRPPVQVHGDAGAAAAAATAAGAVGDCVPAPAPDVTPLSRACADVAVGSRGGGRRAAGAAILPGGGASTRRRTSARPRPPAPPTRWDWRCCPAAAAVARWRAPAWTKATKQTAPAPAHARWTRRRPPPAARALPAGAAPPATRRRCRPLAATVRILPTRRARVVCTSITGFCSRCRPGAAVAAPVALSAAAAAGARAAARRRFRGSGSRRAPVACYAAGAACRRAPEQYFGGSSSD